MGGGGRGEGSAKAPGVAGLQSSSIGNGSAHSSSDSMCVCAWLSYPSKLFFSPLALPVV